MSCARLPITTPTLPSWSAARFQCRVWRRPRTLPPCPDEEALGRCHEVARAFRFAEDLLQKEGLGTFGHIMTRAVDVLTRRKSVLERAQRRARFILIDEFQDSNVAQIKLASLLGRRSSQRLRRRRSRPGHLSVSRRHQRCLRSLPANLRGRSRRARDHVGQPPLHAAHPALCVPGHQVQPGDRHAPTEAGPASRSPAPARNAIHCWRTRPAVQAIVHNGGEQEAALRR